MFRFSLEIIFSAFLFLSTWSFIESQSPSAFCSGPISELKFNTFAPKKIYSRASRLNMSFTGDNSVVATFDMFVSNDNVRRLTCAQQTFIKANNSYFQISCLINSSQVFETYGVKMKVNLNFLCNLQPTPQSVDYNYQLPQVELILIDPLVKLVEPETILRGHNCSYKIRYSGVDLEVGIPTPVELELKNGTRCTKKTDYSDFSVRMADVFTCFIGAGEYNLGYKLNASLLLNNHTWRTIPITVDTVPTIAQSHGSTFAGTIIGISFTGANLRSFRGAYLTTEHFSEPNYCTIVSETLMKCDCALGLPPVQSTRQVKVYFWSHGNQLANSGSQITLQQNPAPIRETIKSFIKGYVMTILIENYKSDYIPWTKIKVYDTYENNVVECGNIKMNGNNNVTCLLDEEVSPSPDHQKLQITIGTWNANKNFNPVIEKIDLFFFQLAISFVLGLLLIYTVLYFLIRYKFKRPFNVRQVALAISHLVMAARSKLSLSTHKSMVSSKKSFTSLGRSKISLESKSKSKLDKITSKSLPKLTPVKKLKSILRRKSDLKYNSMLPDVTSLLTKSNRSLVLESKSSDGEIAVLKGKSKVLTKHPLRHKPKIPMTKGVKKLFSKAKSKPSLKQFKRRKP